MGTAVNEVVKSALKKFAREPHTAAKQLRALAESCQQDLARAIVPAMSEPETRPGLNYLLALLAGRGILFGRLTDPREFTLPEAVLISQLLLKLDPNFEARLTAAASSPGSPPGAAERALLIVDPRRRADYVEALWQAPPDETRPVFSRFAADPNHRVRANALLGLYRCGDPEGPSGLFAMAKSEDWNCRAAAAWAVQTIADVRFLQLMRTMAKESGRVGRNAKRAIEALEAAEARMRALPAPSLSVGDFRPQADQSEIEAVVVGADGTAAGGLPVTQFIVLVDSNPVERYAGEECERGGGPAYRLRFSVETGSDGQPMLPVSLLLASPAVGYAEIVVHPPAG